MNTSARVQNALLYLLGLSLGAVSLPFWIVSLASTFIVVALTGAMREIYDARVIDDD